MKKISYSTIQKKAHGLKEDSIHVPLMFSDSHPAKYSLMSWQNAVMNNMTMLGYWEWRVIIMIVELIKKDYSSLDDAASKFENNNIQFDINKLNDDDEIYNDIEIYIKSCL